VASHPQCAINQGSKEVAVRGIVQQVIAEAGIQQRLGESSCFVDAIQKVNGQTAW